MTAAEKPQANTEKKSHMINKAQSQTGAEKFTQN